MLKIQGGHFYIPDIENIYFITSACQYSANGKAIPTIVACTTNNSYGHFPFESIFEPRTKRFRCPFHQVVRGNTRVLDMYLIQRFNFKTTNYLLHKKPLNPPYLKNQGI